MSTEPRNHVVRCGWVIAALACLAVACKQPPAPAADPAAGESTAVAGVAPAAPGAEPTSPADIFPDAPEKSLVLNNCASCHNVACAAIGQRTAARWSTLNESHREHAPDADVDAIFAYLKTHFGESKPEPRVPAIFLEGGCTPF